MNAQLLNSVVGSTQNDINKYYIGQTSKIPKLSIPCDSKTQNNHQQYDQLSTWRGQTRNRFMDSFIVSSSGAKPIFDQQLQKWRSSKKLYFIEEQGKASSLSPNSHEHSQIIGKYNSFWEYKNNVFQKYFWGNGVYAISDLTDLFSQLQQKLKTIFDQIYCEVSKDEDSNLLQAIENQIIQRQTAAVNQFVYRIQTILQQSQLESRRMLTDQMNSKVSYDNNESTKVQSKNKYFLMNQSTQNYVDYLNQNILKHIQSIQQFSYGQILEHSKYTAKLSRQYALPQSKLSSTHFKSKFTTEQKQKDSEQKNNNYQIINMLDTIYSLRKQNKQLKARLRSLVDDYNSSFSHSVLSSERKVENNQKYHQSASPERPKVYLNSPHSTLLLSQQKQNVDTSNIQFKIQSPKYSSKKLFERIPKYVPINSNQKHVKIVRQSPNQIRSFNPIEINACNIDSPIYQITSKDTQRSQSLKVKRISFDLRLQSKIFDLLINENLNHSVDFSISQFNTLQQQHNQIFKTIEVKAIQKREKMIVERVVSMSIMFENKNDQKQQNKITKNQSIRPCQQLDQSSVIQAGSFFDDQYCGQKRTKNSGYIFSIKQLKQLNKDFKSLFKLYVSNTWSLNQKIIYFQHFFRKIQRVFQQIDQLIAFSNFNQKKKIRQLINSIKLQEINCGTKMREQMNKTTYQYSSLRVEYTNTQSAIQAFLIFNKWCIDKAQDQKQLLQTLKNTNF